MEKSSDNEPQHRPVTTDRHREPSRQNASRLSNTTPSPLPNGRVYTAGGQLNSLSALYQPAFKPYSFSHMYDSKYSNDFQGRFWPPPLPTRVETSNYAPIKHQFRTTTYQDHFKQMAPFNVSSVVPFSRHRKNNPQPNMINTYNYPDGPRWIWATNSSSGARASTASEIQSNKTPSKPTTLPPLELEITRLVRPGWQRYGGVQPLQRIVTGM